MSRSLFVILLIDEMIFYSAKKIKKLQADSILYGNTAVRRLGRDIGSIPLNLEQWATEGEKGNDGIRPKSDAS